MKTPHIDNTPEADLQPQHEEEPLIPLITPEPIAETSNKDNSEKDDDKLDDKAAHRKLLEAFTDDDGEKTTINIPNFMSGEVLTALKKHWLWLTMIVTLTFFYVSNRYYTQEQMIHNNRLKEELKEVHYNAMARSSELMRNCRRSTIMEQLNADPQNTLQPSEKQPAVITDDE